MSESIPAESNAKGFSLSAIKTILLAGFAAGTADILAAIGVYSLVMGRVGAVQILQSIAAGVFGKQAFAGGWETTLCGIVFHYIIATSWGSAYFLVFPYISFLRNQKIISGLLYGVLVWILMNTVVLPLSNASQPQFRWDSILIGMMILMLCIGLPISLITHKYYTSK
jgi:hypothetical protein